MATLVTLASFSIDDQGVAPDGSYPLGGVILDAAGNLFGTTQDGGADGNGTVFEIANGPGGYAATPTTLATFDGTDGSGAEAGLSMDAHGNLFGTTANGGPSYAPGTPGLGTVFEVAHGAGGYAGTPTVLAGFDGSGAYAPSGEPIADAAGDLFGTTTFGGAHGDGTVYEIAATAGGYAASPTILASFDDPGTGAFPMGALVADAAGDLFGTTNEGGPDESGTVFELAKTADGYASAPVTLAAFSSTDGAQPVAGLILDAAGDLFGTTSSGGPDGAGTVFEIVHAEDGYASAPTVLATFDGADGDDPSASLVKDDSGNLFGTTDSGGANDLGTVFEIARTAEGYAPTPVTLVSFDATGGVPQSRLRVDAAGDLFGTTASDVPGSPSTVFEITGTGFDVACFAAGTQLATPSGARAVESLAPGDPVLTASGAARPIVWLGHRTVDCRRHPRPHDVWPIRVAAHAFAAGKPRRDLLLSPDHAILVDGVLIPVRYLANGRTIVQRPREWVTYWHVELACHDIVLAEGMPCESFLDTGNRAAFNGGSVVHGHPDFAARVWDAEACAPLVVGGARVAEARRRLCNVRERSAAVGR